MARNCSVCGFKLVGKKYHGFLDEEGTKLLCFEHAKEPDQQKAEQEVWRKDYEKWCKTEARKEKLEAKRK